jgi:Lrp/AsnC family transcriptional regulator, regulator of ectoine-degradation genes
MLAADLSIDRYMTYIVTRTIKTTQPNLTKLVVKESLPVTMSKQPTFQ